MDTIFREIPAICSRIVSDPTVKSVLFLIFSTIQSIVVRIA
jgi:hypothetical protein